MKRFTPSTEHGQALVIFALAAIGIFAIVGLAIDGSAKFSDRRHAQNAADTAALAGALARIRAEEQGLSDADIQIAMEVAARNQADENGYDGNLVSNQVWVYSCNDIDPTSPGDCGPYNGNSRYIEVVIESFVNTSFARVIGVAETKNTVRAVALTRDGGILGDGAMIISYDPDPNCSTGGTGGYSVQVNGSSTVNLNGGGIFLNSHDVCGFKIPNCADLNIYGGAGINSVGANNIDTAGCTFDPPITPNFNQEPIVIPDEIYFPDEPPECSVAAPAPVQLGVDPSDGRGEWLIRPGFYSNFPQAGLVANKQHIYMASGVYCIDPPMDQDLSWSPVEFVSLNGSRDPSKNKYSVHNPDGVTLYIKAGGGFSINANNITYLDASTTGDYQGYLIILEGTHPSIEDCSITGGSKIDINGLIFAPYCDITVNGGSEPTAEINAQLLGWDIKINGTTTINFNYDPSNQVTIEHQIGLMR